MPTVLTRGRVILVLLLAVAIPSAHFAWVFVDTTRYRSVMRVTVGQESFPASSEQLRTADVPARFETHRDLLVKSTEASERLGRLPRQERRAELERLLATSGPRQRAEAEAINHAVRPWGPTLDWVLDR